MSLEPLEELLHVSTQAGDFLIVNQMCRSCVVTLPDLDTRADLILLDTVDFNTTLGMNWLATS